MTEFQKMPLSIRSKIIEVEAMQWDGSRKNIKDICDWVRPFGEYFEDPILSYVHKGNDDVEDVILLNAHGDYAVHEKDWIVHAEDGEFYVFSDASFKIVFIEPQTTETFLEKYSSSTFDEKRRS